MSKEQNLRRARKIKSSIALDLRRLKNGNITLRSVLETPQSTSLVHCSVFNVLRAAPNLGEKGAKRVLLESKVWPMDKVGNLSQYELDLILSNLPARAR
jgi:hypothetical protein